MASQLKRDLLAMQTGKNKQVAPYARASKANMVNTTATVSKSSNHPVKGGSVKIGTKHPTGADRSPVNIAKAKSGKHGVKFSTPTPTGKATPTKKIPGATPMKIQGIIAGK